MMKLFLFTILLLLNGSIFCRGQSDISSSNGSVKLKKSTPSKRHINKKTTEVFDTNYITKIYSLAIADYIHLVKKEYKITFDTLFFGKHVYGQPDDFPDIKLPEVVEKTNIRLISPDEGKKIQKQNNSATYVNMVGWVDNKKAEFIFVTFSNGVTHQFDCFINYLCNELSNDYTLHDSRFENYAYKK